MVTRSDLTKKKEKYINQFSDYMATYPDAVIRFHASDRILRANTDASYMIKSEACSRAAGFFLRGCTFKICAGAPKCTNTLLM